MGAASRRRLQRVQEALVDGRPRRARALARLLSRTAVGVERAWLALLEANALLWEGHHARAASFIERRLSDEDTTLGVAPVVVLLEALLLDERVAEARVLFARRERTLREARHLRGHVALVAGMLAFHDGDLAEARRELADVFVATPRHDPIRRIADFVLAAIAHRHGDRKTARVRLEAAARGAGESFIARWATMQLEALSIDIDRRPSIRPPGTVRRFFGALSAGLLLALFRLAPFERTSFSFALVSALASFDALFVIALRALDYERGATPYAAGFLVILVPLLGVAFTVRVVTTARVPALRMAGGVYAALPMFLALAYAATHAQWVPAAHIAVEAALGVWLASVAAVVAASVRRMRMPRFFATVVAFSATCLFPLWIARDTPAFFASMPDVTDWSAEEGRREAAIFEEAFQLDEAESQLRTGRADVVDIYFVGAGLYASQDVFGRDVRYAREAMDTRFDTRGRSLLLVNDRFGPERAPLASATSLRHALKTVGRNMNRDEDVLFLYLTSHGSQSGLVLSFPHGSPFRPDTLSPGDLRSMLDDAGIRWRVLIIAGCESGVFLAPLASDTSVVATAASNDRYSYGCAMGNAQTDFGRAVFADHLGRDATIVGALRAAIAEIEEQERRDGRVASRPQLAVGADIAQKLDELEHALAARGLGRSP